MIFNFLIVFSNGENGHETGLKIKYSGCLHALVLFFTVTKVMEMAQKELKTLLPDKFHIPSNHIRRLDSVGHG